MCHFDTSFETLCLLILFQCYVMFHMELHDNIVTYLNNSMKSIHCILVLLLGLVSTINTDLLTSCFHLSFLPMPQNIECNMANKTPFLLENPCSILYIIKDSKTEGQHGHFIELIKHQQLKTFGCHISNVVSGELLDFKPVGFDYTVEIEVKDVQLKSVFTTKQEAYTISIDNVKANIKADTYVGFVRGLETFMQAITCNKKKAKCMMTFLPIKIQDEPAYSYRGLMIDTARHYQPIHLIYETIDALMYNKMSIMHWHIVDEDSFPLKLDSHPEIAEYAAFSPEQIYTTDQVKDIIRYAMVRGVRVIPELDTPGHAASWGKAPQNKQLACTFGSSGYMGPLDVTLDATYKLVKQIFTEIFKLFPDPIVHLGGDQVVLTCLSNKTDFISKQGITESAIQIHYRKKQRKMLKQVNESKKFMYWMNGRVELEEDDIVHWWGGGLPQLQKQNQVVISIYGPFYIDMGVGNYFGFNYGNYVSWLDLYNQNIGRLVSTYNNKKNVLGAEVTLWSQLSNQYTHHSKIWIRTSSLAERAWTTRDHQAKPDFLRRITAHQRLMNRRGIPTAPATCQQCQFNPQFC